MKKQVYLLLLAFVLPLFSISQETVYIVKDSKKRKSNSRVVEHMNVIKYDPLQIAAGELKFSWEHVVSEKTSFEISLGPTFDGIGTFRFNGNGFGPYTTQDGIGVTSEVGYRFYPLDDMPALNRLYISPVIGYKFYSSTLKADETYYPGLGQRNSLRQRGYFSFNVGMQSWLAKSFSIDYYVGFGVARRVEDNFFIAENFNPDSNSFSYNWSNSPFRDNVVQFKMGVKFGIGFTK